MIPAGVPSVPRLVLVTDRQATAGRDLVDVVCAALDAGLPAVQLREKDMSGAALLGLAEQLRKATEARRALLFVNDRVDVALAVGADGVQLGHGAVSVADARRLLSPGALVGVSTHETMAANDADFFVFGAVYPTPGKSAVGAVALRAAVDAARPVPVLAIGGITAAEVPELRAFGAAGVAVIRAILGAPDPAAATRALLAAAR
jgi:thiamine-phosphate pyrophosphorylase